MPEWFVIVLRSLGAIVILFLLTRILGKKQMSQLTFFEYITGITLGELAGFISTELEAHYMYGVIALLVWFTVPFIMEHLAMGNRKLRQLLEGKPTVVIQGGKILEDNLKKERFSADELMEQLRKKDVFDISEVEYAVLDPTGDLNVLKTKETQPLTPKSLGIKMAKEPSPQVVIMNGKALTEALGQLGFNLGWLRTELEKLGVSMDNVFIGQVDAYGQLTVDLFDDKLQVPKGQEKEALFALLKKIAADLELFRLTTENPKAKQLYGNCVKQMEQIIKDLTPYLNR
ncbi:DUF421 domain-containing protein [Gorillibacterium massiliense]|uniref:DUF421 domain-containing protein n=1 Tax=Gorillibacterium massiliense TaxID=1280390 RepID=UPI0004BA61DA|nr:DUF421 domain-containing protein [Gorillibacterium massiliense]